MSVTKVKLTVKGVDYSEAIAPDDYKCSNCDATGIKLWRMYQSFPRRLLCASCTAEGQNENIDDIDAEGYRSSKFGGRTDQIGCFVPAIPDEEGSGWWGYTSVPPAGVDWWRNLPTK